MAIPTLTIGVVDQQLYIYAGSMTLKRNTLDLSLINPATVPTLGDAVTMTNPTWAGHVASIKKSTLTDKQGNKIITISATNDDEAAASAAPWNLSDTPNNTTTFGYRELTVEETDNTDDTITTNGSCIVFHEGLWPGMTVQLTSSDLGYSATDFTVTDVTVTWLKADQAAYNIQFGDPIVTMSVWLNESAADFILPIDETKITDGAVTTPKIATNAITADKIEVGTITADKLAAELILASTIKTAESGSRVELDTNGMRNYSSDGQLLVNIPTNGTDPVSVVGQIEASSLVSNVSAELHGTNTFAKGSTSVLEVGVTNPSAAPTVVSSLDSLTLTSTPAHVGHGICYDSAGDSGGATATYWIGADPTATGSTDVAYEFNATTGALLRTIQKTGTTTTATTTLGATTHIYDTTQAYSGTSESQIATPLTMPRDGTITKISAYLAGYGGDATCQMHLWDSSGNRYSGGYSATFTAAGRTFSNGNDVRYEKTLTTPRFLASGTTFWAGWVHTDSGDGHFYSRDDGSGKTTKRGDGLTGDMTGISTDSATKPNVYVTYTYTVDSSIEGTMGKIIGVARQGTYIWVLDIYGTLFRYNQSDLAYVDKFDLSAYVAGTKANAGLFFDGTNLIITTATGVTGTDKTRFIKVTTAGAYSSTLSDTGLSINGSTATIRGGYADATYYWVSISGVGGGPVVPFTKSTGVIAYNKNFGTDAEAVSGVTYDGSYFRGYASASYPTKIWEYTDWDWTTESNVYWVAYSWYDSVGTTHETALSPRTSITMGRRRKMLVSNPAIPVSGADDPDKVRIYMLRNATEPTAGTYEMQVEDALTSREFTSYTTVNGNDATSNNFPAGTAATLASSATGWTLKASGLINRTGTAFPGSPATDDHFWRSDLDMEFFYDGTRWLSTQLLSITIPVYSASVVGPVGSTLANAFRCSGPSLMGGSNIWLETFAVGYNLVAGTGPDASNKWTLTLGVYPAATTAASVVIDSGAEGVWTQEETAVDALLGDGRSMWVVDITKTGSPGSIYTWSPNVTYRIVAT
jgi:hypothetical protein